MADGERNTGPVGLVGLGNMGSALAGRLAAQYPLIAYDVRPTDAIRELAACPNVHLKLGGLAMIVNAFDFHLAPLPPSSGELANAWRPYVETCIEAFGAKRCMFESNFPVDKGSYSYPVFWNACKRLASGASAREKADLFSGTAARFYRLALPG